MPTPLVDDSPCQDEWRDAFSDICDRHRGRLSRWLSAIFGPTDAEDIAQETLVRLYTRPWLLDESADAWPWLSVVARNVGRDLARRNARSTSVDAVALAHVAADVVVLDEVVARDEGATLARALRSLTSRERTLIRLRDFDGASIGEISDLLGLNENAVRQQLFRARRRLAHAYVELGGDSRFGSLVAAFGLRLRELARRWTPLLEELGPSAAALGIAVPAVAALVGGVAGLVPGFGGGPDRGAPVGATTVVAAAPVRWEPGDSDVRHGTGRASAPSPSSAALPDPPTLYDVHEDIPFGHVDATWDDDLWDDEGGEFNHDRTEITIPATPYTSEHTIWTEGYIHEYPGGPTACRVIQCP